jgi:hypothetical protein
LKSHFSYDFTGFCRRADILRQTLSWQDAGTLIMMRHRHLFSKKDVDATTSPAILSLRRPPSLK